MTHTHYVIPVKGHKLCKYAMKSICNGQGCSLKAEMLRMGDETQFDIHSYAKRQYKENSYFGKYSKIFISSCLNNRQ